MQIWLREFSLVVAAGSVSERFDCPSVHALLDLVVVVVGLQQSKAGIQYMLLASAIVVTILLARDEVGRLGGLACILLYIPSVLV